MAAPDLEVPTPAGGDGGPGDCAAVSAIGAALLVVRFSGDVVTGELLADALMVDRSWLMARAPEAAAAIGARLAAAPARLGAAEAGGGAEVAVVVRPDVREAATAEWFGFAALVDRTALPMIAAVSLAGTERADGAEPVLAARVGGFAVTRVAAFRAARGATGAGAFRAVVAAVPAGAFREGVLAGLAALLGAGLDAGRVTDLAAGFEADVAAVFFAGVALGRAPVEEDGAAAARVCPRAGFDGALVAALAWLLRLFTVAGAFAVER